MITNKVNIENYKEAYDNLNDAIATLLIYPNDNKKLLSFYGEAGKFLHSPFSQFSVKDTFTFFEKSSNETVSF